MFKTFFSRYGAGFCHGGVFYYLDLLYFILYYPSLGYDFNNGNVRSWIKSLRIYLGVSINKMLFLIGDLFMFYSFSIYLYFI